MEHAIRGLDAVTLLHADSGATENLLVGTMGFRKVAVDGHHVRYQSGDGGSGTFVDLLHNPHAAPGRVAGGSVHHIAFRNADDDAQAEWQSRLFEAGHPTTEVKDRMYFHSIWMSWAENCACRPGWRATATASSSRFLLSKILGKSRPERLRDELIARGRFAPR